MHDAETQGADGVRRAKRLIPGDRTLRRWATPVSAVEPLSEDGRRLYDAAAASVAGGYLSVPLSRLVRLAGLTPSAGVDAILECRRLGWLEVGEDGCRVVEGVVGETVYVQGEEAGDE